MCKLQLAMETQEGSQILGSIDINLAPYFEQTGVVKTIPLLDLKLIESASITVSFSVSSSAETVPSSNDDDIAAMID